MRISDWSSDVCSSDLPRASRRDHFPLRSTRSPHRARHLRGAHRAHIRDPPGCRLTGPPESPPPLLSLLICYEEKAVMPRAQGHAPAPARRSEEHTSELQSLMRISYAVFCLKKKQKPLT